MTAWTRSLLSVVEFRAPSMRSVSALRWLSSRARYRSRLRGKVLVQHRFADMGGFGDLVHRGAVVAVGDEDFLRGRQQLGPALVAGQPGGPLARRRGGRRKSDCAA